MRISLKEIAAHIGARIVGNGATSIAGVGSLAHAEPGQLAFLSNPRLRGQLATTGASAVIVREEDLPFANTDALVVSDPHVAFARAAALFQLPPPAVRGIHPSAVVDPSAQIDPSASVGPCAVLGEGVVIGADCIVGPGCVVMRGSRLGDGTRLAANVTIYPDVVIGARVLIHGGAVIGSDGFGFAHSEGRWVKVPQLGGVRVGDDVEIGACTTIDCGALEPTVIEEGVKIDNLVQVAHNVRIGAHTAIAGCAGIAGSTIIGRHCAIGGGAGILGHLELADGVIITARSLVTKSITEPGSYSSGVPLEPSQRWHRNFARFKQLDEMAHRLRSLEKELEQLKNERRGQS